MNTNQISKIKYTKDMILNRKKMIDNCWVKSSIGTCARG